jgi:hypothetical protein
MTAEWMDTRQITLKDRSQKAHVMLPPASEITFESRGRSLLSGVALIGADVRSWHFSDIEAALLNVGRSNCPTFG